MAHYPQNQHCATRRTARILANTTDKSMITPQDIFRFIFFAFWGGILFLLVIVWWVVYKCSEPGKAWRNNIIATIVVLGGVLAWIFIPSADERRLNREAEIRRQNYLKGKALFEERCKTAGEKVYRTADNVEGVTLLKVWDTEYPETDNIQLWEYAGLPMQSTTYGYMYGFLGWRIKKIRNDLDNLYSNNISEDVISSYDIRAIDERYIIQRGYHYVDIKQENGKYLRYSFKNPYDKELIEVVTSPISIPSYYAVTFDNFIDLEERKYWIAHTRATIIDTRTNEVMATKDWYSFEPEQGYANSFYPMWLDADTCPSTKYFSGGQIELFTQSVLNPK